MSRQLKFEEDLAVLFTKTQHPRDGMIVAKGMIARLMNDAGPPSKVAGVEMTFRRERIRLVVRAWHRGENTQHIWISPGFYTMTLRRFAWCWIKAAVKRWREPIPRAHVVRR